MDDGAGRRSETKTGDKGLPVPRLRFTSQSRCRPGNHPVCLLTATVLPPTSLPRPPSRPLLIAHRGESRDAPENTLAAIRLAWARGARAVEIDVRQSADGEAFVIHDATTTRIRGPRRAVRAQRAADLAAVDAGAWKSARWKGEPLPRLADVLRTVPPGGRLFVEVKDGPECLPAVRRAVISSGVLERQLLFMSFNRETVAGLPAVFHRSDVCLLLTARAGARGRSLASAIAFAHRHALAGLNLEATGALDAGVVAEVHAAGLAAYCWTVNRVSTARRLARAGIDGITTDRCAWMTRMLCAPVD